MEVCSRGNKQTGLRPNESQNFRNPTQKKNAHFNDNSPTQLIDLTEDEVETTTSIRVDSPEPSTSHDGSLFSSQQANRTATRLQNPNKFAHFNDLIKENFPGIIKVKDGKKFIVVANDDEINKELQQKFDDIECKTNLSKNDKISILKLIMDVSPCIGLINKIKAHLKSRYNLQKEEMVKEHTMEYICGYCEHRIFARRDTMQNQS